MAIALDRFDNRLAHGQPVALLHIGAVDQRRQFVQAPGQQRRIGQLLQVLTHARFEATGRRQALRGLQHADGAAGVQD
ncbi:hypothetical protein D3C72_2134730 [compost metagenome]